MKVLVTGCGLSGTHYSTKVLRKAGMDVGHERVRRQGAVSWLHATWLHQACWDQVLTCGNPAWTGGDIREPTDGSVDEFDAVVRQLRNPRKIATSFARDAHGSSWRFARDVIEGVYGIDFPWPPKRDLVAAGVCYTWWWLRLAGEKARWTYRVEDMEAVLPDLLSLWGANWYDGLLEEALETDTKSASRQRKKGYEYWSWKDIEDVRWGAQLHAFAEQFGYE